MGAKLDFSTWWEKLNHQSGIFILINELQVTAVK